MYTRWAGVQLCQSSGPTLPNPRRHCWFNGKLALLFIIFSQFNYWIYTHRSQPSHPLCRWSHLYMSFLLFWCVNFRCRPHSYQCHLSLSSWTSPFFTFTQRNERKAWSCSTNQWTCWWCVPIPEEMGIQNDILKFSLFVADTLQAIGGAVNAKWVHSGKVEAGTFCDAQGWLLYGWRLCIPSIFVCRYHQKCRRDRRRTVQSGKFYSHSGTRLIDSTVARSFRLSASTHV